MLQGEVFIFEFGSVDGFATSAVVVGEVTGLTHEVWNDTMENGSLVSETFFARAQSAEVFTGLWYYIRTKLKRKLNCQLTHALLYYQVISAMKGACDVDIIII